MTNKKDIGHEIYRALKEKNETPLTFFKLNKGISNAYYEYDLEIKDIHQILEIFLRSGRYSNNFSYCVLNNLNQDLKEIGIFIKPTDPAYWGQPVLPRLLEEIFWVISECWSIIKIHNTNCQESEE